jgi:hypothetical protein
MSFRKTLSRLGPRSLMTQTLHNPWLTCIIGLALFASNPFRDLWFYEDVAAHEGFGTTEDSYIIGFADQLLATVMFFPVAVFLIVVGIGYAHRRSFRPSLNMIRWPWAILSTLLACLMLIIEWDYLVYCIQHVHHFDTFAFSLLYLGFIYYWWCCSLTHRSPQEQPQQP